MHIEIAAQSALHAPQLRPLSTRVRRRIRAAILMSALAFSCELPALASENYSSEYYSDVAEVTPVAETDEVLDDAVAEVEADVATEEVRSDVATPEDEDEAAVESEPVSSVSATEDTAATEVPDEATVQSAVAEVVQDEAPVAEIQPVQNSELPPSPPTSLQNVPGVALPDAPPGTEGTPGAGGTPPGAGAPGAGAPGAGMPQMPPLPMLLGIADFLITADRPFDAENIYRGILFADPNNVAAQRGLQEALEAQETTYTYLGHYYSDDRDVKLWATGGGPIVRTPYGRFTLTAGTGRYRNDNDTNNPNNPLSLSPDIPSAEDNASLQKNTLNMLFEPYYKKWEGSFFFSNVTYDGAPDRFLYDLKVGYVPDPARHRYYISHGRHDSYFQNVNNQFYAPESYFQLVKKTMYKDYSYGVDYPLTKRIDASFSHRHFKYTDGNTRDNFRTLLMYRLRPTGMNQMPVWRVGFDLIFDDSKFFTLDYTASENFNAYSIATDYLWLSRKLKYGVFASYPIARQNFTPPRGVFGFASYQLGGSAELYFKLAQLQAPGNSLTFRDYVLGVNAHF